MMIISTVKELIASQKNGTTVPLAEVVNGERTGKTINLKLMGQLLGLLVIWHLML
jgi:hypothetical protein